MEGEVELDEATLCNRNKLKLDLVNLFMAEKISRKQKSRERWLQENSKYFYVMASNRRRSNYTSEI